MADLRNYPEGRGVTQARYIDNVLVEYGVKKGVRVRCSAAALTAGVVLVPQLKGVRWRMFDAKMIAIGGAAASATSINIQGLVSSSVTQLLASAVAGLTQSTVLRAGATNAAVLADGASFTQQDVNAALTAKTVGSALTGSTFIDVFLEYIADPA